MWMSTMIMTKTYRYNVVANVVAAETLFAAVAVAPETTEVSLGVEMGIMVAGSRYMMSAMV